MKRIVCKKKSQIEFFVETYVFNGILSREVKRFYKHLYHWTTSPQSHGFNNQLTQFFLNKKKTLQCRLSCVKSVDVLLTAHKLERGQLGGVYGYIYMASAIDMVQIIIVWGLFITYRHYIHWINLSTVFFCKLVIIMTPW